MVSFWALLILSHLLKLRQQREKLYLITCFNIDDDDDDDDDGGGGDSHGAGILIPRGGGYAGFLVTGMIEWGQKTKPKKIPGPKIPPPPEKIPCRISKP